MHDSAVCVSTSAQNARDGGTWLGDVRVDPPSLDVRRSPVRVEDAWLEREVRMGDGADFAEVFVTYFYLRSNLLGQLAERFLAFVQAREDVQPQAPREGIVLVFRLHCDDEHLDPFSLRLVVEDAGYHVTTRRIGSTEVKSVYLGSSPPAEMRIRVSEEAGQPPVGAFRFKLQVAGELGEGAA
ncbi:MAG: hypothetical protein AAF809_03320 [Bacteroidota bacterium]